MHIILPRSICCILNYNFCTVSFNKANFPINDSINNSALLKSAKEKALMFVSQSTRIRLQDLKDNPGAKTMVLKVYCKKLLIFLSHVKLHLHIIRLGTRLVSCNAQQNHH